MSQAELMATALWNPFAADWEWQLPLLRPGMVAGVQPSAYNFGPAATLWPVVDAGGVRFLGNAVLVESGRFAFWEIMWPVRQPGLYRARVALVVAPPRWATGLPYGGVEGVEGPPEEMDVCGVADSLSDLGSLVAASPALAARLMMEAFL